MENMDNASVNATEQRFFAKQNCHPFLESSLAKSIQTMIYCMFMISSLVGNILVILTISRDRKMKKATYCFIANMSLSDVIFVLFVIPRQIKSIYLPYKIWIGEGVIGSMTCKIVQFIFYLTMIVSVLSLLLIAVARFWSVVYPMRKQPFEKKKTSLAFIILTWIIGAMFPSIYFYKSRIIYRDKVPYCISSWKPAFNNEKALRVQFPIYLTLFTVIPFIVLTTLYSIIIVSLHRQKKNLHLATEIQQFRVKEYKRVTFMLVIIAVVYLVAWIPASMNAFLFVYMWSYPPPCYTKYLVFIATLLPCGYSVLNPMIYYIFVRSFRNGFRALLRSCFQRRLCNTRKSSSKEAKKNISLRTMGSNFGTNSKPISSELASRNESTSKPVVLVSTRSLIED